MSPTFLIRALLVAIAALVLPVATMPANAAPPAVEVAISEVNLYGPAISPVTVTVTNNSSSRLSKLKVTFSGPVGWSVYPESRTLKGSIRPGDSADLSFQIRVPEKRAGFQVRTFTATATYSGADGNGSATGTRVQRSGEALPSLAAAYNNVGVTNEGDPGPGNFDGDGNSFSAQKLADQGVTPGATVNALGASFTWPTAPPGTPDNVTGAGQAIELDGTGQKLAFLGSGSSFGASGRATVYYTDGTTSSGVFGFPNWSFQEPTAHGATLVVSTDGRNTPGGYANANVKYRVFAHSIPLDPAKVVDMVVLPSAGSLHIFDMKIVS